MAAQVMIEFVPDTTKVKSALEGIEAGGGEVEAFKQGNAELQKRNQLLTQNEQAEKKQLATIQSISKATSQMSAEVINQSKQEITATISLRGEKKKLTEEIGRLIVAGQQQSKMFKELVARAGEIDDAMKDASDAIARTGSDTRGIDNAILAARGIASAFTVATGVTALFGEENEEVQKVLLKVNAAMAVLNGLQEIQNLLKSEYIKTLFATNTAQAASVAATQAQAVATTEATAAQTGLNVAMEANPIGLVAGAMVTLVAAYETYRSVTDEATEATDRFNTAMDSAQIDRQVAALQNVLSVQSAIADLLGETQSQITQLEIEQLIKVIALRKTERQGLLDQIFLGKLTDKQREEALKKSADLLTEINAKQAELTIKDIQYVKLQSEEKKKAAEDEKKRQDEAAAESKKNNDKKIADNNRVEDERVKGFQKTKDAEERLQLDTAAIRLKFQLEEQDNRQKQIDDNKASLEQQGQDALAKAREINAKLQKGMSEQFKNERDERIAIERYIAQQTIAIIQQASTAIFDLRRLQRQAELEEETRLLEERKDKALQTENLTADQKKQIQQRYEKDLAKIKNEAARKQRKADIAEAFVNTALAVVNALASAPFPYNVIAAAAAGVAGGIQIAKIASTPLPQYAKGGKNVPPGYALVGEEGPEIVKLKGGEDIFMASKSEKMMRDWTFNNSSMGIGKSGELIDYEQLGRAVAKHLPQSPNVSMVADEHGLTMYLEQGNYRRTIRNKRYSFS